MSDQLQCQAPRCTAAARKWRVAKEGRTEELVRCDDHAASLRARGYEVKQPPKWDLTSTNSIESAAEYWRKQSGAVLVLVIRAADAVVAVDEGINPGDVRLAIDAALHEAVGRLDARQREKRAKAVQRQIRSGVNPEEMRYA